MKRIILTLTVLCLFALALSGCDVVMGLLDQSAPEEEHVHTGGEATCTEQAVCEGCNEAYGELKEHTYADADCENAKHCTVCSLTDGEALGHSYTEANCESAATCTKCGKTNGEKLGHRYSDATCTEPMICAVCGDKLGESLGHKYGLDYLYDDVKHWKTCLECGENGSDGLHTGGEISGEERAKCSVCSAYYGEYPDVSIDWTIEALSPALGSTFCLANDRVKNWYETFNFRTTDTDAYWLGEDIFLPETPFFSWSVGEDAQYYKVYISKSADFVSYDCYLTATPALTVEHLYTGHTYYWFVDAVYSSYTVRSEVFTFFTMATPRTVDIEGVSNSRDIGGYMTLDGKRIKQGLVYRSAKLDDITELGRYTLVNLLGVKTDLDLRGDRNDYYKNATHPVRELQHIVVACPWYSTGSNHIWLDDYNKAEFAKAIKVFADPDNYPIIFHCSLGRDRTGTLAMVLEGLLGVDENTLMMEYELSVFSYWGTNGSTKYNDGLRKNIHDTYLYISDNYEGDSFSEKVESFLLEIGVTAEEIASIKDIMLEEVE